MLFSPKSNSTESGNILVILLCLAGLIILTSPLWAEPLFAVWNAASQIQQSTAGW